MQEQRQEELDDASLAGVDFDTHGHAQHSILPTAANENAVLLQSDLGLIDEAARCIPDGIVPVLLASPSVSLWRVNESVSRLAAAVRPAKVEITDKYTMLTTANDLSTRSDFG